MSNNRALNDYTANLPLSQKRKKEKEFKEPLKSLKNPSTGSPMESKQKISKYIIAPS